MSDYIGDGTSYGIDEVDSIRIVSLSLISTAALAQKF
jgi:hypothetical protein